MAFRKCPSHGWLATSEYGVREDGEPVCPVCESTLHDYRDDNSPPPGPPAAHKYPRQRFSDALDEFFERCSAP